jgi:hypothetical protein
MSLRTLDDRQREVSSVSGNPINPDGVTRKGVQGRPDVQHAFGRIKQFGLPVGLASWVENALGHPIDREHPDALAIQKALQILADIHAYRGVDRVEAVLGARRDGSLLSEQERQTLSAAGQQRRSEMLTEADLAVAYENEAGEIASAAFEILLARQSMPDFSDVEAETLRQLHTWQHTGKDRPELPDQIERDARKLVTTRMRGERGEIPRTRPVSHTDRRRMRTYYNPSFRQQLGRLYWETDRREVQRLVAELARQTKNRQVPVYSTGSGDAPPTEAMQR